MERSFKKREKTVGSVRKSRQYDLPLENSAGTSFLILLIALMTFLAVQAVAAAFALDAMTARWATGLENRVTVEIPAEAQNGKVRNAAEVAALTERVDNILSVHPAVLNTHILSKEEIGTLVEPWLGKDLPLKDIPLPGLVSVELKESNDTVLKIIEEKVQAIAENGRLDTHESWLNDLLRFTGALKFAAAALLIVIGVTTVTAIAGAVKSRMAMHHQEVELLHLMGARDRYISAQFQRHSLLMGLKGGLAGLFLGGLTLLLIGWISGEMGVNLLPDFSLSKTQIAVLFLIPVAIAALAALTAKRTVLQTLAELP